MRRKKIAFKPILPKAGAGNDTSNEPNKGIKTKEAPKEIQPNDPIAEIKPKDPATEISPKTLSDQLKSHAEEKTLPQKDGDGEKTTSSVQPPPTKTRRKKTIVAPNTKARTASKPVKKVSFTENSSSISEACESNKPVTDDRVKPKTKVINKVVLHESPTVEPTVEPSDQETNKSEAAVKPKLTTIDDGAIVNDNRLSTEVDGQTMSIHGDSSASTLNSHKHVSTGSITKPSIPSSKTREQIVKEQFGVEDKNIRQRNALKKLRNIESLNKDETNKDWSNMVRDSLLMSDLIYCNPPKNSAKELGITTTLRKMKEKEQQKPDTSSDTQANTQPILKEPDPPAPQDNAVIAPQIRLNEDGSVVIDEESLVINSSNAETVVNDTPAIYENSFSLISQASFRNLQAPKRSLWSEKQTKKFYDALRIVGADFGLMSAMFRNRNDRELRRKYNLERKKYSWKVDEALKHQHLSKWTNDMFMPDSSSDEEPRRGSRNKKKSKKTSTSKRKALSSSFEPTSKKTPLPNNVFVS